MIDQIASTVAAWRGDDGERKYEDVAGYCRSVPLSEIAEHEHALTPSGYVGSEQVEDDDDSFAEKMQNLTLNLSAQMAKGAELDALIRRQLGGIGYDL